MTVSFDILKAGDRVKLTRANGDEVTITVAGVAYDLSLIFEQFGTSFMDTEWDTVEILEKPLPTKTGYYLPRDSSDDVEEGLYFQSAGYGWQRDAGLEWVDVEESEVPRNLVRLVKES